MARTIARRVALVRTALANHGNNEAQRLLHEAKLRALEALSDDLSFAVYKNAASRRQFMKLCGFEG